MRRAAEEKRTSPSTPFFTIQSPKRLRNLTHLYHFTLKDSFQFVVRVVVREESLDADSRFAK